MHIQYAFLPFTISTKTAQAFDSGSLGHRKGYDELIFPDVQLTYVTPPFRVFNKLRKQENVTIFIRIQ